MKRIAVTCLLAVMIAGNMASRTCADPITAPLVHYLKKTATSTDVGPRQMLAYSADRSKFYVGGQNTIRQKNSSTFATITSNSGGANAGLPTNHLGGSDTLDDNLYVAANRYASCAGDSTSPHLLIFAPKPGLPRIAAHDLTGQISPNPSGVGIDRAQRKSYWIDFCDPAQVSTLSLPRSATDAPVPGPPITLQQGFRRYQGIALGNSRLYITGNRTQNPDRLNSVAVFSMTGALLAEYVLTEFPGDDYEIEDIKILSTAQFAVILHDKGYGGSFIAYFAEP